MKKVLFFSLTVLLSGLFIIGCGGSKSTPEDTAKEFISLVEKGNMDALDLMAPELVQMLGKEKLEKALAESGQKFKDNGGVKSVDISDKVIKDNEATMKVTTNFNNGKSETEKMKMINKDGKWLITISK
jgi:hypothetical protein